ncbi:hypothetical protein [Desulfovibrio ferrophilus]|uniref:Uncharacterized protein n=1 Tax=Desulfovibrio ferrophilus TaxID=241368 RepID=A0A2Z6AVH5_9BACT|nr:hypothetical protein [Desulfovibrio ferrophilus]BBD07218.1 uncharacterized protein DFE_0492 [Desulfovibrio ferrophilus]
MAKLDPQSLDYLLQTDVLEDLIPRVGREQWQSLFVSRNDELGRFGLWCALIDDASVERVLSHYSWDLSIGDGKPGFSQSWPNGEPVIEYHPYGSGTGIRALVHRRSFYGVFSPYFEIDQEFRLYHDLAYDQKRGLLLAFDVSGREIEVVRISPERIEARLKYLRQYQAGTRQNLVIYVDSVRYSKLLFEDVGERRDSERNERVAWSRHVGACSFHNDFSTFSRVLFKIILRSPVIEKAGIWPFDEEGDEREVTFIIGVDENGENIEHTSSPDKLSNNFGANPEAPHYLTPVYFRREVLAKYFAEPDRYVISDGSLGCLELWHCQIDNDLETSVAVFLGDLGRDLPYEERLHWRQFNIPPEGEISETNFRRSFLAQFTDPSAVDLVFKEEYKRFAADWLKEIGWPFFLPLAPGDIHLADTIRIPVTNSQSEMDDQVLCLTKLLVDSLNEKEFARVGQPLADGAKGIAKLNAFFQASDFADRKAIVDFLKNLQLLRSTGSGHRKGSGYDKAIAKLDIDLKRKPEAFALLLDRGVAMLRALRVYYLDGEVTLD